MKSTSNRIFPSFLVFFSCIMFFNCGPVFEDTDLECTNGITIEFPFVESLRGTHFFESEQIVTEATFHDNKTFNFYYKGICSDYGNLDLDSTFCVGDSNELIIFEFSLSGVYNYRQSISITEISGKDSPCFFGCQYSTIKGTCHLTIFESTDPSLTGTIYGSYRVNCSSKNMNIWLPEGLNHFKFRVVAG